MKSWIEKAVIGFAWGCGLILSGAVACLVVYLLYHGAGALTVSLIFGDVRPLDAILLRKQVFDGIFPAIVGTLVLVLVSVSIAAPLGIAAGIFMAEYSRGRLRRLFSLFLDILAGIPSILVGLFGFSVAVFLHHHFSDRIYPCLLISSLSLAFLVLPYLIRTTQNSLENIPESLRITAPALGSTRFQNIFYVLLPQSLSGILSGVLLSIGRCAEDTAVIMLTGVVATAGVPKSLFANYEALPFYIYYVSSQYADAEELMRGYGAAIVLLCICAVLFLLSLLIKRGLSYHVSCGA